MSEEERDRPQETVGRTGFDFVWLSRRFILAILVMVAGALIYYLISRTTDMSGVADAIGGAIREYWYLILAPFAGFYIGMKVVRSFYAPDGRYLIWCDIDSHEFRVFWVPSAMFREMRQTGNCVAYHTATGESAYIVNDIDWDSMDITYSWVHEQDPFVVQCKLEYFQQWISDYQDVLKENIESKEFTRAIALGMTRESLNSHLDEIWQLLGLRPRDPPVVREEPHEAPDQSEEVTPYVQEQSA